MKELVTVSNVCVNTDMFIVLSISRGKGIGFEVTCRLVV